MNIGLNTYHVTDRYGRYESGERDTDSLLFSATDIVSQRVSHVELLLDLCVQNPETVRPEMVEGLRSLSERHNVSYSGHLPYKYVDIASLNETIRLASQSSFVIAIETADQIGAEKLVFHPVGAEAKALDAPGFPASAAVRKMIIDDMIGCLRETLRHLQDKVESRRLCLENLAFIDLDLFEPLVEEFDLGICMDVGHLIMRGGDPIRFIRQHAKRIGVVHLHDVVSVGSSSGVAALRDHEPLGTGMVDWVSILQELEQTGFDGPVVLEHLEENKARASLAFLKEHYQSSVRAST